MCYVYVFVYVRVCVYMSLSLPLLIWDMVKRWTALSFNNTQSHAAQYTHSQYALGLGIHTCDSASVCVCVCVCVSVSVCVCLCVCVYGESWSDSSLAIQTLSTVSDLWLSIS